MPEELTLPDRREALPVGIGTGTGMVGLRASIAATRFGSTPSGPPIGDAVPSPSKAPPRDLARRWALVLREEDVMRLLRLSVRTELPPAVGGVPVKMAEPEALLLSRLSHLCTGDPVSIDDGALVEGAEDMEDGKPSPSELSSLIFPMAMTDTFLSTGSSTGELDPIARRGTAGGPIEPLELVTELLRVRLDPAVTSSEVAEDASSSATLALADELLREGVRFIRVAPVAALCRELLVDRSRSNLDAGFVTGMFPDGSRRMEVLRPKLMCFASAPAGLSIAKGSEGCALPSALEASKGGERLEEAACSF